MYDTRQVHCLLWMVPEENSQVTTTRLCFARKMTALEAVPTGIREGHPGMTSMIPRAVIHNHFSEWRIRLDLYDFIRVFLTMTDVSDICWSAVPPVTRTTCSFSFVFIVNTLLSAT